MPDDAARSTDQPPPAEADLDRLVRPDLIGPLLTRVTGDEAWLRVRPEVIAGGRSNLTFTLVSAAGELVLRRPPSGAVLATAHDMGRETTVQRALAGSSVPVPRVVLDDAGELIGVPFYVMTKVPGLVVREKLPAGFAVTAQERKAVGEGLIDVLADLHRIDPATVGLENFGRPEGFAQRQVRRWGKQIAATPGDTLPVLDALSARLLTGLPADPPTGIVHGDYRLDNCVVDADTPGRINGVLDWEMSTLGDPLTDLGMFLFYWESVSELAPSVVRTVSGLPGFPTGADLADRWSQRTGIGIERIDWYRGLAHFKFAGIVLGIQARARAGVMADPGFGDLTAVAEACAEAGLAVLGTGR